MAPLKQQMHQHLSSAKEWVTRAEAAFDKERDVRAELDLMLAQAEIQHVKEANSSRQWRYKSLLLRHGVACILALAAVTVISGTYLFIHTGKPEVLPAVPPAARQAIEPAEPAKPVETAVAVQPGTLPENNKNSKLDIAESREPLPISKPESRAKAETVQQPDTKAPAQQPAVVSTDEMKKLVRAAGKTLRGQ